LEFNISELVLELVGAFLLELQLSADDISVGLFQLAEALLVELLLQQSVHLSEHFLHLALVLTVI